MEEVKALLTPDNINGEGDQKPPLHLAASGGHPEIVEFLISKGAEINKTESNYGWETSCSFSLNHV